MKDYKLKMRDLHVSHTLCFGPVGLEHLKEDVVLLFIIKRKSESYDVAKEGKKKNSCSHK